MLSGPKRMTGKCICHDSFLEKVIFTFMSLLIAQYTSQVCQEFYSAHASLSEQESTLSVDQWEVLPLT